ncbi:hypothetical protein DYH09_26770 [bacterium CPR1]|nr:hypothetical protein [bacterium CPR1]
MQVHVLGRDAVMRTVYERADRLKSCELSDPGSAAARAVVLREANRLEQIPGADTAAMHSELARLRADSRSGGRKALVVGAGLLAAGAVTGLALAGSFPTGAMIAPIVGTGTAALAFIASYGGLSNDRFYQETGEMLERWTRVATAPPLAPGEWLKTPPAVTPNAPATCQEVLELMQASRGYLAANLDQPGHAAALTEVERDLAGLSARPEERLSDVRASLASEQQALRKQMLKVGYTAMGGMVFGLVGLPFLGATGLALGFGGSAALITVGQVMLQREKKILTLDRHLALWEIQLQQLKDMSAEVHQLANPGQTAGVQRQAGYLVVGGVRVPVAAGS